jgi:hypothetical protein
LDFIKILDIDKDGFIDPYDIEFFLKRNYYMQEDHDKNQKEGSQGQIFWNSTSKIQVVPHEPCSNSNARDILRLIRQALKSKGVSFHEAFRNLD